jgi:hypothetical protein
MKFPAVRLISTVLPGLMDVALAGTVGRTVSCEVQMIPQPKLQRTKSGIWRWRIAIIWLSPPAARVPALRLARRTVFAWALDPLLHPLDDRRSVEISRAAADITTRQIVAKVSNMRLMTGVLTSHIGTFPGFATVMRGPCSLDQRKSIF